MSGESQIKKKSQHTQNTAASRQASRQLGLAGKQVKLRCSDAASDPGSSPIAAAAGGGKDLDNIDMRSSDNAQE